MLDWDGYVRLAFDEIRLAALDRQLRLLADAVARGLDDDDLDAALVPDAQGIGSGTDITIS